MKTLLAVVALCLSAAGQAVYSGAALSSGSLMYGASAGAFFGPTLPAVWVDNNEALDGVNCGGQCSGAGFVAPTYELTLPGTWASGSPAGCTFRTPYWGGSPTDADRGTGLQNVIDDIEACRAAHSFGIIVNLPPDGYARAAGIVVDSTATAMPSQFIVLRSTQDAVLAAKPEPVCAGGIQDNVAVAANPGLRNPDCTGAHLSYRLGNVETSISAGAFTLANGTARNTSDYNYLQYMPKIYCTANTCLPVQLCSIIPTAPTKCSSTTVGPSLWAFYDFAVSLCPGPASGCDAANNNQDIVSTGVQVATAATDISQFANHIHFRRFWVHGDWSDDLTTGVNAIADGFTMDAVQNFSIVGSQISQAMRPAAEGHSVLVRGMRGKIVNNWFEGSSSGTFSGGTSSTPKIPGYVSFQDMEIGRVRYTFPPAWVGFQCATGTSPTNKGNACGNIPDSNYYWGGAGDNWTDAPDCSDTAHVTCVNVSSDGLTITYVSGPPFHDSGSYWQVGHQPVRIYGDSTTYHIATLVGQGTCTAWPAATGCPTSFNVQSPIAGAPLTNVPFWFMGASIVRKNCTEMKEGARVLYYGIICENVDNSGGQDGINFTNAIRSISGVPTGRNYEADMRDITVEGSIFRNSCNGFTNAGSRSGGPGSGSGVSWSQRKVSFTNVLGYNITKTNPGCGPDSFGARIASSGQFWRVTVTENGSGTAATAVAKTAYNQGTGVGLTAAADASGGNTVYTTPNSAADNTLICGSPTGNFLFITGFSTPANNSTFSGFQCIASSPTSLTLANPGGVSETATGTAVPLLANTAGSKAANIGYEVFNILAGEPIFVYGCTGVAAFDMLQTNSQTVGSNTIAAHVGPRATIGSTHWDSAVGFDPSNVTVTYPWSAPPNSVDNTGSCVIGNVQGSPSDLTYNHLTLISDATAAVGTQPAPTPFGPPFSTNHAFINSIFLSQPGAAQAGWYNSVMNTPREGAHTEQFNHDAGTLSAFKLVWPGRATYSSQYVEYGNNPNFPDPGGCTGGGCQPPTATGMYYPATDYCTGATSSSACVGFAGAMNLPGGPMPLALSDYHGYALRSDSAFHNAASNGTDIGASIPAIDAAQTTNQYVCASPCGSPGPYRD